MNVTFDRVSTISRPESAGSVIDTLGNASTGRGGGAAGLGCAMGSGAAAAGAATGATGGATRSTSTGAMARGGSMACAVGEEIIDGAMSA